jgi:hypothetical protein
METNKRAQDILEFFIFVGLGDELMLYREHDPGLSESVVKFLAGGAEDSCWFH